MMSKEERRAYKIFNDGDGINQGMNQRIGLMAGSYDPITKGHMFVISEAMKMVDRLIILVAKNPEKKHLCTLEGRTTMLIESINEQFGVHALLKERIIIDELESDEFTVSAARDFGAKVLFRGLRNVIDFEYEHSIQDINHTIAPNIATVFIMPPPHLVAVSSSIIRGMVGIQGWQSVAQKYIPTPAIHYLERNHVKVI